MRRNLFFIIMLFSVAHLAAQNMVKDSTENNYLRKIEYKIDLNVSLSHNKTPLWLNANKHGLSSLSEMNGYIRTGIKRDIARDEERKWGLGYGLDMALAYKHFSTLNVQQAYLDVRYLKGMLTIGAKEYGMELQNNALSSGGQTFGINARPIPQVRLSLPDYLQLPFGKGWLSMKGHISYGKFTDDNWQEKTTQKLSKYSKDVLYHSKAGYLKIGNEDKFYPWSVVLGLQMVSTFGGTSYAISNNGAVVTELIGNSGFKGFWNAFMPGGADTGEITYQNVEGNQFGSWVAKIQYKKDWHAFSFYADKFFEDHSSLLQLDYDGYGVGAEWENKQRRQYLVYDIKDWLLGFEYNFLPDHWINDIVFEYLYTKYQSGPIYHDHTKTIADHIGGIDNFYNHYIYPGNQHWGQAMGNPLFRSPIYNEDGTLTFKNNRFVAYHLGLGGHPNEYFKWRFLTTYQTGWGTYSSPYTKKHHNLSLMAEATMELHSSKHKWLNNCSVVMGYGADFGSILGGINHGVQITLSKRGFLNF